MQELKIMQDKFNISDKDLYILSKLSSDLKTSSIFEKEKINAKIKTVLGKYKIGFVDNMNIQNLLKKSSVHLRPEFVEKYEDSENSEELKVVGKDGQKKFIFIAVIITIFFVAYTQSMKNTNQKGNSSKQDSSSKQSDCDRFSHEQFVRNNFENSGKSVNGISAMGPSGDCGFVFMVNGYDQSRGIGYICTVKTNGSAGIMIDDVTCDFN